MHRLLLIALLTTSSALIPSINGSWPATIKYNSGDCLQSTAQEAFVRLPGGCNPTSTGANFTGRAWHATCDATATWTISWYQDLTCSAFDFVETLASPLECETNEKNQSESFYCMDQNLPVDIDPTVSDFWPIQTALFSADGCDDSTFFMYRYYRDGICVAELGTGLLVDVQSETTVAFKNYDNDLCQGDPVSQGFLEKNGTCLQLGANLYMRVTDVAGSVETNLTNGSTIFDILSTDDDLSTLVTLVAAAELEDALRNDELTLFAPSNAAFDAFPDMAAAAVVNDTTALTNVLLYHATSGITTSSDIVDGQILTMTNGDALNISISDSGDVSLLFPTGAAMVIRGDLTASNGVVHVVDRVLEPPVVCSDETDCLDGFFCDVIWETSSGRRSLLFGLYQSDQLSGLCRTG